MKFKTLLCVWCCILLFSCESNLLENPSSAIADVSVCFGVKQTKSKTPSSKSVQELKEDSLTLTLEVNDLSGITKINGSLTRASRITKTTLQDFGVLAYHTMNGGFEKCKSQPNFMYNIKVCRAERQLTYAPVKYFPINDKDSVSFFAYAPYNAEHNCLSLSEKTKKGVPFLTYRMPEEVTDQVDLLVADAAMNQTREQDKVAFSFSHALSCISFSIKGNGEKVKSIGLTGITTSGTLKLDASEEITWSNLSQPSSKVYNAGIAYGKDASYVVSTAEGTSSAELMKVDGYLMLIPQQLTEDTKVVVTYENDYTQQIALGKKLSSLVAGKSYHFSILTENKTLPTVRANANCFIVNPEETAVTIPLDNVNTFWGKGGDGAIATHMGAATRSPNAEDLAYVVPENMITNTNYTVELVWSDVDIDLKVESKTATNFTVSGCNKAGNAVVCVKNPSGIILWSWHLWMTDFDPLEGATTLPSGLVAMDRNLGATSATPGEVGTLGLLYQWGRKDPFLGSNSVSEAIRREPVKGKISRHGANGNLLQTVIKPNVYFASNGNFDVDYITSGHLKSRYGFNRWGGAKSNTDQTAYKNEKSIYDPCPEGWRVPFKSDFLGLLLKREDDSRNYGWFYHDFYFPCAGFMNNLGKNIFNTSNDAYYWYSTASFSGQFLASCYCNGHFSGFFLACAESVRPVRDI